LSKLIRLIDWDLTALSAKLISQKFCATLQTNYLHAEKLQILTKVWPAVKLSKVTMLLDVTKLS